MAVTETPPRRQSGGLPSPPVGSRPLDGESPRAFHQRALREKREREEAVAAGEGHEASRACACAGCRMWFAVEAARFARKATPRTSITTFRVDDALVVMNGGAWPR